MYHAKLFVDVHFGHLAADQQPGFSKGWAYRFRKRHGIRCIRKQREAASVKQSDIVEGRESMRKITDPYSLHNIYNMDETSFFYHAEAPTTLSRKGMVAGFKTDKTSLKMAVATNADGSDKLPLLFIGKSMQPRTFKGHIGTEEFGVEYTNIKKAWMNSEIFPRWLRALDLRMMLQRRHILLFVDNVSSHARP
eukprot:jgi/Phyca11/114544/e_gw1.26.385.1